MKKVELEAEEISKKLVSMRLTEEEYKALLLAFYFIGKKAGIERQNSLQIGVFSKYPDGTKSVSASEFVKSLEWLIKEMIEDDSNE